MPRADFGEANGMYQVWTCTIIYNNDRDSPEDVVEIIDPEGHTIAYFHDDADAEAYCAWRNASVAPQA